MKPGDGTWEQRVAPVVRTKGLLAEYTTGMRPSGEWFALGTIHSEHVTIKHPAWVIVGMGQSRDDAIASLTDRLEQEAMRFSVA